MSSYAYYNGQFDKFENIKIPLSDRSIFFGDCVYDAAIGRYDRILWEDEHIERLLNNAKKLGIKHNYTKKKLSSLLREVAIKSGVESYFLYFSLSRNLERRIHSAKDCSKSNMLVTVEQISLKEDPLPLKLITAEDKRYGYCDVKTTNLLPAVIASTEADKRGYDEAVFHRNGIVTECAKSNISILFRGRIKTHPKTSRILPGITREHLLLAADSLDIPCEESPFTLEELFSADEILVTSTSKLCRRVSMIDGLCVGGKAPEIAASLCRRIYSEYVDYCTINAE